MGQKALWIKTAEHWDDTRGENNTCYTLKSFDFIALYSFRLL